MLKKTFGSKPIMAEKEDSEPEEEKKELVFFDVQVDIKPASGKTTIKIVELDSDGKYKWHQGLEYEEFKGVNIIEKLIGITEDSKIKGTITDFNLRKEILNKRANQEKIRAYVTKKQENFINIIGENSEP